MKIEDFKKKHSTKKISALDKFKTEILELHNDNYSLVCITKFLSANGVQTSFQNLSKYIKKIKNTSTDNSEELPKTRIEKPQEPKKENIQEVGIQFPKLQRIGKDTDIKDAPDWAK